MLSPGIEHKFYSWAFLLSLCIWTTAAGLWKHKKRRPQRNRRFLVEEGGFEPPKLTQQIYSLPPLATRELLHMKFGAGGRIRTPDLLITNQLLYQLSYTSI